GASTGRGSRPHAFAFDAHVGAAAARDDADVRGLAFDGQIDDLAIDADGDGAVDANDIDLERLPIDADIELSGRQRRHVDGELVPAELDEVAHGAAEPSMASLRAAS